MKLHSFLRLYFIFEESGGSTLLSLEGILRRQLVYPAIGGEVQVFMAIAVAVVVVVVAVAVVEVAEGEVVVVAEVEEAEVEAEVVAVVVEEEGVVVAALVLAHEPL